MDDNSGCSKRELVLLGVGMLVANVFPAGFGIAQGRYYTLIVGANERRWKRVRNKLKVVADSFRVFDI
ncbi:hypothetical protein Sjap_022300 [Stephania japonica]|uniref:PsbP C-terminal domain-containing protein n=1 Tax=Stephania japonica TaxID=461633 RepID=A0AAP0EVX5_9MAGN